MSFCLFVFIFVGGGHIEVVFENASSQTLVFKVILLHTSNCENFLNYASTSSVRVKFPQVSLMSSEMDNIDAILPPKGIG